MHNLKPQTVGSYLCLSARSINASSISTRNQYVTVRYSKLKHLSVDCQCHIVKPLKSTCDIVAKMEWKRQRDLFPSTQTPSTTASTALYLTEAVSPWLTEGALGPPLTPLALPPQGWTSAGSPYHGQDQPRRGRVSADSPYHGQGQLRRGRVSAGSPYYGQGQPRRGRAESWESSPTPLQ